jgi:hypothetical protein
LLLVLRNSACVCVCVYKDKSEEFKNDHTCETGRPHEGPSISLRQDQTPDLGTYGYPSTHVGSVRIVAGVAQEQRYPSSLTVTVTVTDDLLSLGYSGFRKAPPSPLVCLAVAGRSENAVRFFLAKQDRYSNSEHCDHQSC